MKNALPQGHGLPEAVERNANLLPRSPDGTPSITDVQYEALSTGIAKGKSALVVAPTSTGKTLIGVWALTGWIATDPSHHVVYLVTHRALARQKFEEFKASLTLQYFDGDKKSVVLANGDTVEDGDGGAPENPLDVPLLVATYEKYLAMLAGQGIRQNMRHCLVIADEIQILGDEHRGRNIEILLTLFRTSEWGQIVGLSAVLNDRDAKALSEWLEVALIKSSVREKHLVYECRRPTETLVFRTEQHASGVSKRPRTATEPDEVVTIVRDLYKRDADLPAVVFCMTRARVYEIAEDLGRALGIAVDPKLPLLAGLMESTDAAKRLSRLLKHGIAIHTADLLEHERELVEERLQKNDLKIVIATTTIASGVNFPFKTGVFDSWRRWNSRERRHEPISTNEFHNMAGRVGRMGFEHDFGRVIFTADASFSAGQTAAQYLQPDNVAPITPRIVPEAFEQVILQLVSADVCRSQAELSELLLNTYSANREREFNRAGLAHWSERIEEALSELKGQGFLL